MIKYCVVEKLKNERGNCGDDSDEHISSRQTDKGRTRDGKKTKLAEYIRAIADNQFKQNSKVLAIYDQQMISNNAETQESNCNHP